MARNKEKQYGKLNRLYLLNEKEEYEKKNPKRPRLETLMTVEEIQEWLPSIKKDMDFYLKKSQVTCYSDAHIEECREEVVKLEKEFKAFVRKIKKLAPYPVETTPWTSRPYERKQIDTRVENFTEGFKPIPTPVLDKIPDPSVVQPLGENMHFPLNDEPLVFSIPAQADISSKRTVSDKHKNMLQDTLPASSFKLETKSDDSQKQKSVVSLVTYDSSDSES